MIREAGGDRSAVTEEHASCRIVIKVRITSNPGETFLDRMIALVEGAERQKTPMRSRSTSYWRDSRSFFCSQW